MKKVIYFILVLTILLSGCHPQKAKIENTAATNTPTFSIPTQTSLPTSEPTSVHQNQPAGWWNSSVFYEIFVRSFKDSNNDGIGDFQGIIQKLDYLNDGNPHTQIDLGINALWLMPINPSVSYHGYDVTDYMNVNPQYGTMDDFKQLLKEAHTRGIKVIIDFVINHTSNQHPWFKAALDPNSPYHDYYIWSKTDLGYLGPSGQTVWHLASNGEYYYGVFDASMPDLNYRNPTVTKEIYKITQFWIKDIGVDGFRIDAARHLIEDGKLQINTPETHEWFKEFRKFYKELNPDTMTVGEVWDTASNIAGYVSGDELDLAFDFDLAQGLVAGAAERSSFQVGTVLGNDLPYFQNGLSMATFLTNHDINRSFNSFGNIIDKAKNAAAMLLTLPGVPFIYYGEEIGMTGLKPDKLIRTPMQWSNEAKAGFTASIPWESVNTNFDSVNVALEESDPSSLLSFYKKLIQIRLSNPILQYGNYFPMTYMDSSVFAELRTDGGKGVMVIINLTKNDIQTPEFSLAASDLRGSYLVVDQDTHQKMDSVTFNNQGGFENYVPLATLPANERMVLYLDSGK